MGTRDQRVDAYIAKAQPFAKPILTRFRKAVHAGCPAVQETMKWSFPHFEYKGLLCSMAAFKQHCAFGFWKASLLKTPGKTGAMGQFGRVTSIDDMPAEKALVALVKKAAALNDDGVKSGRATRGPTPPPLTPPYLVAALRKHEKAKETFDAFPPSHRREYIEWLIDAKTDDTRARRLAATIEWLSEGKSRNWKYSR